MVGSSMVDAMVIGGAQTSVTTSIFCDGEALQYPPVMTRFWSSPGALVNSSYGGYLS